MKIALIGCGSIGTFIADAINENKIDVELKYVYDIDVKKGKEFAKRFHTEYKNFDEILKEDLDLILEAAKSIYKIKEFEKAKEIYQKGGSLPDDGVDKKLLQRGEFGELILHLLLRDFHKTVPLLSKIYFKDAYGSTVHGFDAVHIQPETKTLWLGESKIYVSGKNGIKALIEDVKNHFERDYLNDEFAIVSKDLKVLTIFLKKSIG
jgi:hypothetical protein